MAYIILLACGTINKASMHFECLKRSLNGTTQLKLNFNWKIKGDSE